MRRFLIPALMISLLLTGCGTGGAAQRKVEEQRERFAEAEELCFTADVTANLAREVFRCTLLCAADPETVTVEVEAPESVAGIRAKIVNGNAALEYEGISLGVGITGLDRISPVSAAPLLITALRSGFLQRCWTEREDDRELIAAEIFVSDDAALTVWYEADTMTPVCCEFSEEGSVVLRCEIRDFLLR